MDEKINGIGYSLRAQVNIITNNFIIKLFLLDYIKAILHYIDICQSYD